MMNNGANLTANPTLASFRDSSPDALYGSILAIEAVLSVLISEAALGKDENPANSLQALRLKIEELENVRRSTKYGTGAGLIADGMQDSLDAIFRGAEEMLDLARRASP